MAWQHYLSGGGPVGLGPVGVMVGEEQGGGGYSWGGECQQPQQQEVDGRVWVVVQTWEEGLYSA